MEMPLFESGQDRNFQVERTKISSIDAKLWIISNRYKT